MSRIRLSLLIALFALVLLAVFVLYDRGGSKKDTGKDTVGASADEAAAAAAAQQGTAAAQGLPSAGDSPPGSASSGSDPGHGATVSSAQRISEVQAIVAEGANPVKLAHVIAEWAADPAALPARKAALAALRTAMPKDQRQGALLMAGGDAPVALEQDPLWHDLVDATADTWNADNIQAGRDRMLSESKLRARQQLVSSIAKFADSERGMAELTAAQKIGIRSDFVDLYKDLPEAQRRDMEAAVRRMAGENAAELLRGAAPTP